MEYNALWGKRTTEEEVIDELKRSADIYWKYQRLSYGLQREFMEFCMGLRSLNITYDPVFKKILDPERVPKRLEEFLSLCLGEKLKILRVVPNESERLTEGGSLLVMDILVQLESGALVNVEIQKVGYLFPGARCACYSSDLVMRQYSQVREQKRRDGEKFSYKDIKKVYTIVLIQKSTKEFWACQEDYLHYAKQTFNTSLKLDLLQEYLLIPLDIFVENHHNINSKLDAWLYFIASDRLDDVCRVVEKYPEFWELYEEVFRFRFQKEELISMYSDALRILDENTVQYMVEEQREVIEAQKRQLEENDKMLQEQEKALQEQEKALQEQEKALQEQEKALQEQEKALQEQEKAFQEQEKAFQEQEKAFQEQARALHEKDRALEEQDRQTKEQWEVIESQRREIERLRKMLEERA